MSTENQNSEQTTIIGRLAKEVCRALKLGDEGKVDAFFKRQQNALKKAIATVKRNIETRKYEKSTQLSDFDDRIEDAKSELESAYTNVDVDRLSSNASSDDFAMHYWENIERCEKTVKNLEKEKQNYSRSIDEIIEAEEAKVAILESKLESIQ